MADNRNNGENGGESSSSNNSNYSSNRGKRAAVATAEYDKKTDEESPLLPRAGAVEVEDGGNGTPSAAWTGETDFEGLHWTKRPSINWLLPAFFVFAVAFGGIIVPRLNFILSLVCRDYLSDRQLRDPTFVYVPPTNTGDNPQCRTPEVQAKVTEFTLYCSLISGILSAITCPKIGALSDRYGRTLVLAMITCGGLANEVITILAAKFPNTVSYRWLLLGAAFDGICGSFISGMALTHAYATDCVPPSKRAIAFGYFHACLFTGIAIGPLIAAYLYRATGDLLTIFYIALASHTLFILYILFIVPESLTKKRQTTARERHILEIAQVTSINPTTRTWLKAELNFLAPLKILYPTGPGSSPALRRNLILLSAVDTIIFGTAMGSAAVIIYYSGFQFGWGPFETNIFTSVANITRVSTLIVVLPILNYFFRTRVRRNARRASGIHVPLKNSGSDNLDLWTVRGSIIFEILGFALYAIVRRGELFMVAGAMAAFGGIGSPTLQSSLTKHVPHERTGQLLGATGLLHALARIAYPTITSLIYANTVDVFPQTVFVFLSGGFVVAFAMACAIRPHVYLDEQDPRTPVSPSESRTPTHPQNNALTDEEIVGI